MIYVERKAKKQIEKVPEDSRRRIVEALIILEREGFSMELDVKKLQGYGNHYRIRIGKHRVLFEFSADKTQTNPISRKNSPELGFLKCQK